jgi:hypothetical protein
VIRNRISFYDLVVVVFLLMSGSCKLFSVVGTGRAGVTGKWIGINKRGGKQQKAYPCGDQEKDPEDDGCGPELELTNKLMQKRECSSECVVISILTFFISVHGQQFFVVRIVVRLHAFSNKLYILFDTGIWTPFLNHKKSCSF